MGRGLVCAKWFWRMLAVAVLLAASLPLAALAAEGAPADETERATSQAPAGTGVDAATLAALERAHGLASPEAEPKPGFVRAVQAAREAFDRIEIDAESGMSHWRLYRLNAEDAGFDGLRFTIPGDGPRQIVVAGVRKRYTGCRFWDLLPAAGTSGLPAYYSNITYLNDVALADVEAPAQNRMDLTASLGTFEAAREYILWFAFRGSEPEDIWVTISLVPPGTVPMATPSAMARALDLRPLEIHLACRLGVTDVVAEFLDKTPAAVRDLAADGKTPLFSAVTWGSTQVMELLLARGADVNVADKYGQTPLHWAVQTRGERAVEVLIEHGADMLATRADGCDSLQVAAGRGTTDFADTLLEAGMNVDTTGKTGRTPLTYAVEFGDGGMARFLLGHGADVNAAQGDRMSALHRAALLGDEYLLELLLDAGAHVNAAGLGGRTPLDYALVSGSRAAPLLLQEHGGTRTVPAVAPVRSIEEVLPGKPEPCVRLDGDTSSLVVGHDRSFDFIGPFTAEAWVWLNTHVSGPAAVISRSYPVLGPWQLTVEDGLLAGQVAQGNWHPVPEEARYGPLPPHQWLHVAMVYDGRTVRSYVNGERVAEYPAPSTIGTTRNDLTIGRSPYPRQALDGFIREVRVSHTARYSQDFTPQWRSEADEDTFVLLHCDEGKGDVARDDSGRQNNARLIRASWARQ